MKRNGNCKWPSPEFWLVVIMLLTLTALVCIVLCVRIRVPGASTDLRATDLLEYRKTILTVIITAFGAWVGAGAAYFFGRENLRVAAESLLEMRNQSPAERLQHLPIRNVPQRPIDWTVKSADEIGSFYKTMNKKDRWFIPIVNDDGSLENVIHENAIWRFIDDQSAQGVAHADILKKSVADVVAFIQRTPEFKELDHIYVPIGQDDSAGEVHSRMLSKDIYIGVIRDAKGKPTHYTTTADMRMVLLQLP